jgi:signal transduction histidine kinase
MDTSPSPNQAKQEMGFTTSLHHLQPGVLLVTSDGKVSLLNADAARMLGLVWSEGTRVLPLSQTPEWLSAYAREALGAAAINPAQEPHAQAPTSPPATIRVSVVPLPAGSARGGALLLLQDQAAAGQFDQHVRQLDRLANLGTLTAGMAHEIKNALVAGKTFIDLLLEKNKDAELVDVVRREIGRIDGIVSRVLSFSSSARCGHSSIQLNGVLEHSLRLIQLQLENRNIHLNCSLEATPDRLMGDEKELQQAFVNLLLNALDAMGQSGTLTVRSEVLPAVSPQARGKLRVTVTDTGTGISPQAQKHLFEPFFTTKPCGTGLGLAITRRIIREHGGSITAATNPGPGATFAIVLPAPADPD